MNDFKDNQGPPEAESVIELEEALEADISILENPCVKMIQRSYEEGRFACAIVDHSLTVLWTNTSFQNLFRKDPAFQGELLSIFDESLDQEARTNLYRELRSPNAGFTWTGRVMASDRDFPTIIANLMISPIYQSQREQEQQELGFIALVDDVTEENKQLLRGTFKSLLEASLLKDNDTGKHVTRVNNYCREMAERLFRMERFHEIDQEFVETIGLVAAMHDVGKIGTPDDILNKEGPLESWQWDVMKEHTINGAYILSTHPAEMAKQIALFHHEKFNGGGYPYGIAERMIPLPARIVSLADVYDALRMKRSYKEAFTHEKACEIIEKDSETHFDPLLTSIFLEAEDRIASIYSKAADE